MTTMLKRAVAALALAGIVAGTLAPRMASAHAVQQAALKPDHGLQKTPDFRVESVPGSSHNTIRASWTAGHSHCRLQNWKRSDTVYRLTIYPADTLRRAFCSPEGRTLLGAGCIRRDLPPRGVFEASYSETISGLLPETTYYVHLSGTTYHPHSRSDFWIEGRTQITTTASPAPPTPPVPAQTCTYKHRITGIPGTTGGGYTGQILISSEEPNATARIRAFQHDNGHPIDVLDTEGRAVESITLSPAHSVKTLRLEGAQGWHTAIIEHASARAMRSAAVAVRIRSPDVGVSVEHVQGIEHCEPTTGPVTETGTPPPPPPPAPDLAVRGPQALLWPATLDWRATVANIGDGRATKTRIRLYYGERELAAQDVRQALAPGGTWAMSDGLARRGLSTVPRAGSQVRICVDPVPREPESKRANNCASVTVERN